jgi:hypothetical protein
MLALEAWKHWNTHTHTPPLSLSWSIRKSWNKVESLIVRRVDGKPPVGLLPTARSKDERTPEEASNFPTRAGKTVPAFDFVMILHLRELAH